MKYENEPIISDEWLIRLVWKTRVKDRNPIIGQSSFEPRNDEVSGISLFRRSCLADPLDALNVIIEANRECNALVCVSVGLIVKLQLSIRPDPIPQVFGHVLLPDITPESYRTEKQRFNGLFLQLAVEASENIIRRPLA